MLSEQGLTRYYELQGSQPAPPAAPLERSHTWLEPLLESAEGQPGEVCSLQLDVQGIHCAACVWLMNETYRRSAAAQGGGAITVNPALGSVSLSWRRGGLDVKRWIRQVEAFGYQFGPQRKTGSRRSLELPLRLGVSVALAINVMLFSVSFYFGLSPDDPQVFRLFSWLSLLLSSAVVAVGGWPFFTAAVRGLKSGVLHLDLPIALGIVLVYAASVAQLVVGGLNGDRTYFDTLNTFIVLMLTGRLLQERVLERNRRFLLEDDGADGLLVRKVDREALLTIRAPQIQADDVLLIAPQDVVPVEATLLETARVSTDWITGEAAPSEVKAGGVVPAGSVNAQLSAFHVVARTDFARSPLVSLLRSPPAREGAPGDHQRLFSSLARRWVVAVISVASVGFLAWLPAGVDTAVNVAVALLVVTCPCAIGIAIPLAYELTQARLRHAGLFIRSPDLLDRLTRVKRVVFDKTGTLTLGRLELATRPELDATAREVAWNMAVRSRHPVSQAIARALDGARYDVTASVVETPGQGLTWSRADGTWRLGRADWAVEGGAGRDAVLSRDGSQLAALPTREALRPDAAREVEGLRREGYRVHLLSGDSPARVAALASSLGLDPDQAEGALSPEDKADRVRALGAASALYVGDGVNDALAFSAALAAGTPAIDRPVMPARSDFFIVGEGLSALRHGLARSLHLRRVVKRLLVVSTAYNLVAIGVGLAGLMSPLAAAVSMPASTLTLILLTVAMLRRADRAAAAPAGPAPQLSRLVPSA